MRVIKDPFTGDLLLSLDNFESKQVKDKGYVKISTSNNYFGSLRVLYEDLSTILTEELRNIQTIQEKKRHEKLLNK
tara:strand:+ start:336 stop:563 length:228 start_codon:yes stop_codon:yes gene_type:complete